jgi:hypothetical protein
MHPCRWRRSSEISEVGKSSLMSLPSRYRRSDGTVSRPVGGGVHRTAAFGRQFRSYGRVLFLIHDASARTPPLDGSDVSNPYPRRSQHIAFRF